MTERIPGTSRKGFIFPVAIGLVCIMAILGWMYLSHTIQSKHTSFSFLLDNIAFSIAESAAAEGRLYLSKRINSDPELQEFVAGMQPRSAPREGKLPLQINLEILPRTSEIGTNLLGIGNLQIEGEMSLHDIQREFPPQKLGTGEETDLSFEGEFQAVLRFDFVVTLKWGSRIQKSRFVFEFDFKHACLRSPSQGRENRGYPSSATNDYVLFVRDCCGEFGEKFAQTLNSPQFLIDLETPREGKVFLGAENLANVDSNVFFNLPGTLAPMIPQPPATIVFTWMELCQLLPKLTSSIESEIRAQIPASARSKVSEILNSFSGNLSVEYAPMMGDQPGGWLATASPWKRNAYVNYFKRCQSACERFPELRPKSNPFPFSLRFNGKEYDPTVILEGNIRKRFWVTSTWWLTSSYSDGMKKSIEKKSLSLIERFLPEELERLSPEVQEIHLTIAELEKKYGEVLSTGPHDQYLFGEATSKVKDASFPLPPLQKRLGSGGFNSFRPFGSFFVRSYLFDTAADLMASPLFSLDDQGVPHINLLGLISVKESFRIPAGTRFHGRGMLYSYGDINVEGSFGPASPEDGPCIVMTDSGRIIANSVDEGEITASLIALNYSYPREVSGILCPTGILNVRGNVVVDRLFFTEGTPFSPQPGGRYHIAYDAQRLSGTMPESYVSYVGALVRRMGSTMSVQ